MKRLIEATLIMLLILGLTLMVGHTSSNAATNLPVTNIVLVADNVATGTSTDGGYYGGGGTEGGYSGGGGGTEGGYEGGGNPAPESGFDGGGGLE